MRRDGNHGAAIIGFAALATVAQAGSASAPQRRYPLETTDRLRLHNVTAEPATHQGRKGLRLTRSTEAARRLAAMTPDERTRASFEEVAWIEGLEFSSGVIEVEVAGTPAPGAAEGARGFVGVAFRVQPDMSTYDAFYLRPTNGRAEDQERRNHSTQYIAHPDWPWYRLRKETPSRYEAYVDLLPGAWTKIRIEVSGERARLYVHGQEQPTLVVNDLKTGAQGKGAVALWIGAATIAHFRDLRVSPGPPR